MIKFTTDPVAKFETVLRACEQMYPGARIRFRVVEPVQGEYYFANTQQLANYATFVEHVRETLRSEINEKIEVLVEWVVGDDLNPHIARDKIWFRNDDPVTRLRIDLGEFREKLLEANRNDKFIPIRERTIAAGCELAHLATYLELKCRHCREPVELGYNTCASCAEEAAP